MSSIASHKATPSFQKGVIPLAEVLGAHPFLAGMKPEHLEVLCNCAMRMEFTADQVIFREGDLANRFYLIEEGAVALESTSNDEPGTMLQMLGAGDVLGWSWLFPPYYWHFDARTVQPTKAIFFYGTRLRSQCEEDHDFGYELVRRMAAVAIERLQALRLQHVKSYRGTKSVK